MTTTTTTIVDGRCDAAFAGPHGSSSSQQPVSPSWLDPSPSAWPGLLEDQRGPGCGVRLRSLLPASLWTLHTPVGPFTDQAEAHVVAWARGMGLIGSEEAENRFRAARVGEFASRVYPTATQDDACLAADWIAWLDCLDDQNDDDPLGLNPDMFDEVMAGIDAAGRDSPGPADTGPLGAALADLMARSTARTDAAVGRRLRHHVSDYLIGNSWQAGYKWLGILPDADYYPQMRRQAGGILPTFDLIEIVEQAALPASVYYSPTYQHMLLAAGDVVCWSNDLLTVDKESATGDILNYTLVLRDTCPEGCQCRAQERVRQLIDGRIRDYLSAETGLDGLCDRLGLEDATRAGTARCAQGLRAWMRGHVDWGLVTGRYAAAALGQRPAYLENLMSPMSPAAAR